MTDPADPAPPATTQAKTPKDYDRERVELDNIVMRMRLYAPSKLYGVLVVARSIISANTEDSK